MQTVKVFKLGKAQAVRIPARYRLQADEVEVTQKDGVLILRPKLCTMGEIIARVHAKYGKIDLQLPDDPPPEPIEPLEV